MSRTLRRARVSAAVAAVLAASVALAPTSAPAAGPDGTDAAHTAPSALSAAMATAVGPAGGLWAPQRLDLTVTKKGGQRLWLQPGAHFVAGDGAVEFRSTRPSYSSPVTTTWSNGTATGTLPEGTVKNLAGFDNFATTTLKDRTGKVIKRQKVRVCFGEGASRARPDAPAYSGYPMAACAWNPYALGTVSGLAQGWAAPLDLYGGITAVLKRGRYTLSTSLNPVVADALGVTAENRTRTTTVVVSRHDHSSHDHLQKAPGATGPKAAKRPTLRPAGTEPRKASDGTLADPKPDLRSLPAWQISLNRKGTLLRFGATVWNGGDSPLIVDGFRNSTDENVMDAYQYFFDADGTQTGYQQVGEIKFHGGNHQHWHFQDFARYRLLNADKTPAVTSGKVSFCLANTDVVDYTVPGADWNPYNTDLSTSCGQPGSLSLRQVLSSGSGDTYAQFRTGQAFNISKLKNGWYWISVEANPSGRLIEGDTTNNVSLRKVWIGGKPGARKIRVPKIGVIDESMYGF
ncbi:MAG: lysyl oxidase family protein [Nocardioides sp.]|uniref:lysyl oxidase family protein n=1 Tax=Nocardioides sp. TaxID=35761 RepID=UPI003F00E8D6